MTADHSKRAAPDHRASERAFVAVNLPLLGIILSLLIDALMAPSPRYALVGAMLALVALPWQILVFVLLGIVRLQVAGRRGESAAPEARADLMAHGLRGWILGGAISGLWIILVPLAGDVAAWGANQLLGMEDHHGALAPSQDQFKRIALAGFFLLGPIIGLVVSMRMIERAHRSGLAAGENSDFPAA